MEANPQLQSPVGSKTKGRSNRTSKEIDLSAPLEMGPEIFSYKEWTQESLCEGDDADTFFSASTVLVSKVQCMKCPVQMQCLIWALIYKEEGVWGGTTLEERKANYTPEMIATLTQRAIELDQYYRRPTTIDEILKLIQGPAA